METPSSAQTLPTSPGFLLAKHALLQYGLVLLLFSLFAATDSWQHLTGWPLATVLASIMGLLAGFSTTTVLHEWFHWLGARLSGGTYTIPPQPGLFVYDWDFDKSDVKQFFTMSIGGNIGGLLALVWLASSIETDTVARAALIAGSVAVYFRQTVPMQAYQKSATLAILDEAGHRIGVPGLECRLEGPRASRSEHS